MTIQRGDITFTLTLDDVLAAQRLAAPSPWRRTIVEAALFATSCAVPMVIGGSRSAAFVVASSAALAVVYAGLAGFARDRWLAFRVRRAFRLRSDYRGPYHGRWDDTGLESESAGSRSRVRWGDFVKRREDDRTVLLYGPTPAPMFIPKRVLSPAQIASLRPLLDVIHVDRGSRRPSRAGLPRADLPGEAA